MKRDPAGQGINRVPGLKNIPKIAEEEGRVNINLSNLRPAIQITTTKRGEASGQFSIGTNFRLTAKKSFSTLQKE